MNTEMAGGVVGAIPYKVLDLIFYKSQEWHACTCGTPEAVYCIEGKFGGGKFDKFANRPWFANTYN